MGADARFELIEGELVEYPLHGGQHGATTGRLTTQIGTHLRANPRCELYAGQVGCVLGRNPDTVLAPDLAFLGRDRLPDHLDDGFLLLPPDLVVEVLEPWESEDDVERKIRIYLDAGVRQVWIANPAHHEFRIHFADRSEAIFGGNDIITGGPLLPGLVLSVADIFE